MRPKVNMYDQKWSETLAAAESVGYKPTLLFAFARGYQAAISNIKKYGMRRVEENATTGCAS